MSSIVSVESFLIAVPFRHGGPPPRGDVRPWSTMETLFVRVRTSDGLSGWGEAFGFGGCTVTRTALETMIAPLCIGRDSADVATLLDDVLRRLHNFGRNGPIMYAMSGIDIALWDIAGQRAGVPLHRLLGAEAKARVPAYASLMRYGKEDLVARNAAEAVARGYRQVKLHETAAENIVAGRNAVGPDIELMVDCNCAWTPADALSMARRLAPCNLKWLEEPVWPPEDLEGLGRLSAEAGTVTAAGENASTLIDFERLADVGRVSFLQPSVTKIGGVTGMLRVMQAAKERDVAIAPHSPYFGPGLIATLHLCAALPEGTCVERLYCDLEASPFGDLVHAEDGSMRVPDAPGLGVTVDEDTIARYRTG